MNPEFISLVNRTEGAVARFRVDLADMQARANELERRWREPTWNELWRLFVNKLTGKK